MRARRALLMAATLIAVLGVALPAAPASAATAPPKAIVLTATPTTTVWSQATKLSLSLTPKGGGQPKGGTLTFKAGETVLGTAVATKRITTFSTAALPVGENTITAEYSGDGATRPATSNSVVVTVAPANTTTTLVATTPSVEPGTKAELKATVRTKAPASATNRPTGTVTFTRGTTKATVPVNASGVATWRPTLAEGVHEITATYNGATTFAPSTSGLVTQTVAPAVLEGELDQANTQTGGAMSTGYHVPVFQTFTAGRTGLLTKVAIDFGFADRGANISIYETEGGLPTGTAHSLTAVTTKWKWTEVVLAEAFPVTAGTQYGIMIENTDYQGLGFYTTPSYIYEGGEAWMRFVQGGAWSNAFDLDIGFQTWVAGAPD